MLPRTFFNLSPGHPIGEKLASNIGASIGSFDTRLFPDGESYLRILTDVTDQDVIIFCDLYQPNEKLFPLLTFAHNARELGAKRNLLVTPYLPYMRQDKRFNPGESITSAHFAKHLSFAFDGLVTVDPHLHRYPTLDCIYTLEGMVTTARQVIVEYLKTLDDPLLLIGPDSESEQWVSTIASDASLPYEILLKERSGDYDVEVSTPHLSHWTNHRPVLVDDIISSGRTMLKTLEHLESADMPKALIIGVHGIFAGDAYKLLAKKAEVITCNSIAHSSNKLDLTYTLAEKINHYLK
jgi:ribose-phosphate pyrophosphokinase